MSTRLPYFEAMDEMKRLKELNPTDDYQVMMRECNQPGKK